MGVHVHGGTMSGALTPICQTCGVSLCWDIDRTTYLEARPFWDAWRCQDCAGSRLSARAWIAANGVDALPPAVRAVVDPFADAHPEYGEADAAVGRSAEACALFAAALADAGIASGTVRAAGTDADPHLAVLVVGLHVDWTAVVHDDAAPFPTVWRAEHGRPVEKPLAPELEAILADLDEDALAALVALAVERRRTRAAA